MVSLVVVSISSSVTVPCAKVLASSHMPEDEWKEGKEEWKKGGRECGRKEEGKGRWEGGTGEGRNGGNGKALCMGGRDGRMEEGTDGRMEWMQMARGIDEC